MKKFYVFCDFDKEEEWLNTMAKKGNILQSYSNFGIYTFEKGNSQDLNYKVDYKATFKSHSDYIDYLTLFEDAGWEHVWGSKNSINQYFLAKTGDSNEDIFSDDTSADERYKTALKIFLLGSFLWLLIIVIDLFFSRSLFNNFLFLTPGLWKMTGSLFWKSFFFELPFVIFRIILRLIFWILGISSIYFLIKTANILKSKKNQNI